MTKYTSLHTEALRLPYQHYLEQVNGYGIAPDRSDEMLVMALNLQHGTVPAEQNSYAHNPMEAVAASKQIMELAGVVLGMRGETQYPGHRYQFKAGKASAEQLDALQAMIGQHRYQGTQRFGGLGRICHRRQPHELMTLGGETQAMAMQLAVGRHFVALEALAPDASVLAYGYVPGIHPHRKQQGFLIAELATNAGTGEKWNELTERAAAAIITHVVSTPHSAYEPENRLAQQGTSLNVHLAGDFKSIDTRNIVLEAAFQTARVGHRGGLDLSSPHSTDVASYLRGAYDLDATRTIHIPQKS